MLEWHPQSWERYHASQQPDYDDAEAVERVVAQLKMHAEPIVTFEGIERLLVRLREIVEEEDSMVFIHAGDCAETFDSCNRDRLIRDVNFLSSMAEVVDAPLVIGRICGQFGKPRSNPIEEHPIAGSIPVFRGDIVNGVDPADRKHDPTRMIEAHRLSKGMVELLGSEESVFTSHECLLLPYESALVRYSGPHAYNTSAHFLWIGDRTRELDGAHVEFCRGVRNPIGIKVSHTADPSDIVEIVKKLNPDRLPGKVTIITRFGASNSPDDLIRAIQESGCPPVVWQCDPMHGNTVQVGKRKTRRLEDIKREISRTIEAHIRNGSRLHGIHLESTGADVTECIGCDVTEDALNQNYMSACDPRLNPQQTRHVLDFVNELLRGACTPTKSPVCDRMTTSTTTSVSHSSSDEAHTP